MTIKKTLNLIYRLEGGEVDDGIDVFQLAPILLSIGSLIKEGHKTLHPGKREIVVNVKPFEKGSFIIDINLFSQNNLQQIIDFANKDSIKEIKEVLEWVGIISGGAGSLIWLIKKLRKPPTKIEKLKEDEYRYSAEDGVSITINGNIHKLYQNPNIQESLPRAYVDLFDKINLDKVSSYLKDESDGTTVIVDNNDVSAFRSYANADLSLTSEFEETFFEVLLNPKRGSFEAERDNWSFRMGGNRDQIITATIKDENFLASVRDGDIKPHFKDLIKAKVKMKQEIKEQQVSATTYEIIQVLEYRPAPPSKIQEPLITEK